jgi:hypothetical protein
MRTLAIAVLVAMACSKNDHLAVDVMPLDCRSITDARSCVLAWNCQVELHQCVGDNCTEPTTPVVASCDNLVTPILTSGPGCVSLDEANCTHRHDCRLLRMTGDSTAVSCVGP